MTNREFIESGILEQYVLGTASPDECKEVELRAAADPVIQQELDTICDTLEALAIENAIKPDPIIKPFLMAVINYTERIRNGEPVSEPPLLTAQSTLADYAEWLNRSDMVSPKTEEVYAKIIGFSKDVTTAIVWLKTYAPQEVHDDEYERFLIVEGSCEIVVDDEVNKFVAGDYFQIPLHKKHFVKVTSSTPCKIILQRVAA